MATRHVPSAASSETDLPCICTPVPEPARCKIFTCSLTSPAFPLRLCWGFQHFKGRCASPGRIRYARGDLFVRLKLQLFLVWIVLFSIMPGAAVMAQVEAAPRSNRDERAASDKVSANSCDRNSGTAGLASLSRVGEPAHRQRGLSGSDASSPIESVARQTSRRVAQ